MVFFIFSLSGWGTYPYIKFFKKERDPLERFLIIQAIGLTLTWLFTFTICAFKVLIPTFPHLWVFGGAVLYLINMRKGVLKVGWYSGLISDIQDRHMKSLVILLGSIITLTFAIFLYFNFAPTSTWDPLDYHYVLPSQWLANGGFVNLPEIMYSNFPASVELIWLTGFALRGDIVANLFTLWFGILMVLSLVLAGKRFFNTAAGWIGAVMFLALPIVYTEEIPGGVIDLAVFTFNILAVYFAVLYIKDNHREDFFLSWLFASNGLAMKHSSLLTVIFIVFLFLYKGYREKTISISRQRSINFLTYAFILPLPWYIKSIIYTGNPVYPFLNGIFNPGSNLSIDILYWSNPNFTRGFFDWLTYWYRVITDVSMVQFRFRLIDGIYLGMLPFLYWAVKKPGYHRAFIAYSFFVILLLLYHAPGEPRYQLAAWGLLGIALGFGLFESGVFKDSTMRYIYPLALIAPITIMLVMCVHENRNKSRYILGRESRRDYYMKNIGVYPLISYMNEKTPEDSVVVWCDPRILLFERDYIPAYPFDTGNLLSWREEPVDIVKDWRERGVTHLGFTMAANYRAWVVGVILDQAELDQVDSGFMYIENNTAPGIKYEGGDKLDYDFHPMDRQVYRLGAITKRSLQLASYATAGLDYVKKDNIRMYRADLAKLKKERENDIDVIMILKLIKIGNLGFLTPAKVAESEGILFKINYTPPERLSDGGEN